MNLFQQISYRTPCSQYCLCMLQTQYLNCLYFREHLRLLVYRVQCTRVGVATSLLLISIVEEYGVLQQRVYISAQQAPIFRVASCGVASGGLHNSATRTILRDRRDGTQHGSFRAPRWCCHEPHIKNIQQKKAPTKRKRKKY